MSELKIADLEIAINTWNYADAVERTKPLVLKWTNATLALYRELYLAREALSRKGTNYQRIEGIPVKTWSDFCNDIGYSRRTVNAKLQNFVPAELSETGEDTFLIEEKLSKTDRDAKSLAKIAQFRATGLRPQDWTNEDEAMLRLQEAEHKAVEASHIMARSIMDYKKQYNPSRDYFTEMLAKDQVKQITKFKINDKKIRTAQQLAGDTIAQFLFSIEDLNERAKAAANLVIRLKDIINDSLEEAVASESSAQDADFEVIE